MENIFSSANKFKEVALVEGHRNWANAIKRLKEKKLKSDEIRTAFDRDANRILHSASYSRLKDKTQVFFHADNDRICTRIEHINHVSSVSSTIARFLGLNSELTHAISLGHDLGHAPFGHSGEKILDNIVRELYSTEFKHDGNNIDVQPLPHANNTLKHNYFWHEKNSLNTVDNIALLQNTAGNLVNLNLTYAVRDGIISHCGEVSDIALKPRLEVVDLTTINRPNKFSPYTWEACVVKVSDKISYLGRDIEDALKLSILNTEQLEELSKICNKGEEGVVINNTVLIHSLIIDLCKNSTIDKGICFSSEYAELMHKVITFNYKNIYKHKRLKNYEAYAKLVISSIYEFLYEAYRAETTIKYIETDLVPIFPILCKDFISWLNTYSYSIDLDRQCSGLKIESVADVLGSNEHHKRLYNLSDKKDYVRAITEFIASLTDRGIISYFDEMMRFP